MGKISLRIDTFIKTVKFTVYGLHDMLISSNEMALVVRNMHPGNGKDLSCGRPFYWGNPLGRKWIPKPAPATAQRKKEEQT